MATKITGGGESPTAARWTVNLSVKSTAAYDEIYAATGDSKTEAVNKALQAYAMIVSRQDKGGGAWLQDDKDSKPIQTRFF